MIGFARGLTWIFVVPDAGALIRAISDCIAASHAVSTLYGRARRACVRQVFMVAIEVSQITFQNNRATVS